MLDLTHVITWFDDRGVPQVEVFDPEDPRQRRQLEQNACDCPICAALLSGRDPVEAMSGNRQQRRLLEKLNRKGRRRH